MARRFCGIDGLPFYRGFVECKTCGSCGRERSATVSVAPVRRATETGALRSAATVTPHRFKTPLLQHAKSPLLLLRARCIVALPMIELASLPNAHGHFGPYGGMFVPE